MANIPLYLKVDPNMPRPADPEFYWITQDGSFLCRNHPFFESDVPTRRPVRTLAPHEAGCRLRYPKLGVAALETIVGFFDNIFQLHGSESVVLLLWDLGKKRYRLMVPDQLASVWESYSGARSEMDVRYLVPQVLPPRHLLVADIHCHGDFGAYASHTDKDDEQYRDGVHAIVGHIDKEPPTFHLEISVDGHRFPLDFDDIFRGYRRRRRTIPEEWIKKVRVKVDRPKSYSWRSARNDDHDAWWEHRGTNRLS